MINTLTNTLAAYFNYIVTNAEYISRGIVVVSVIALAMWLLLMFVVRKDG